MKMRFVNILKLSAIEEIDMFSIKQLIGNILNKDEVLKILKEIIRSIFFLS